VAHSRNDILLNGAAWLGGERRPLRRSPRRRLGCRGCVSIGGTLLDGRCPERSRASNGPGRVRGGNKTLPPAPSRCVASLIAH
jgi:hypothetical protein